MEPDKRLKIDTPRPSHLNASEFQLGDGQTEICCQNVAGTIHVPSAACYGTWIVLATNGTFEAAGCLTINETDRPHNEEPSQSGCCLPRP